MPRAFAAGAYDRDPFGHIRGMSRRSCVGWCGSDCSGRQQMFGVGTPDDVGEGGLLDGLVLEREPTVVLALVLLPAGDLELLDEGSREEHERQHDGRLTLEDKAIEEATFAHIVGRPHPEHLLPASAVTPTPPDP